MTNGPRTVSLVLGSGGARGLAHIGVIRWLTENGYQIRSVSGSSIGALIGGIYATRKLDVYAEWVSALERMHVVRLLDPSFGRAGLFKGERIIAVLRELVGDCAIEELPLAFTAVATDLDSGEEVWLREGRLFDAIRASIATPLLFTPFRLGSRTLLDGALVNPVPIAPTLDDPTDLTIAVNLGGPVEPDPAASQGEAFDDAGRRSRGLIASLQALQSVRSSRPAADSRRGVIDIALAAMRSMQDTLERQRAEASLPDVTIEIPRNACSFHEFWRAEELIALGRECAERALGAAPD